MCEDEDDGQEKRDGHENRCRYILLIGCALFIEKIKCRVDWMLCPCRGYNGCLGADLGAEKESHSKNNRR